MKVIKWVSLFLIKRGEFKQGNSPKNLGSGCSAKQGVADTSYSSHGLNGLPIPCSLNVRGMPIMERKMGENLERV